MQITKEVKNGVPYIQIADSVCQYSYGYFTHNQWVDEDTLVVGEIFPDNQKKAHLVNIAEGTSKLLVDHAVSRVVHGRTLYYMDEGELFAMQVDTMETKKICRFKTPELGTLHMTNDGRYMSVEVREVVYLVDLETGEIYDEIQKKKFAPPFSVSDHYKICPTDKNKVFFAHEGTTTYISNRLWLYERNKGMRCIAKQQLDADGNLGDCFGHESWAADGKGLWFVKYRDSTVFPKGISYVDLEGNQQNAIYGKYPYWHVSCSADGRYLAADAITGDYNGPRFTNHSDEEMARVYECDCCVVNLATGEEHSVIKALTNSDHPGHPHPSLSPHAKWMVFHDVVDGRVAACFVKLEDVGL